MDRIRGKKAEQRRKVGIKERKRREVMWGKGNLERRERI